MLARRLEASTVAAAWPPRTVSTPVTTWSAPTVIPLRDAGAGSEAAVARGIPSRTHPSASSSASGRRRAGAVMGFRG